LVDDGGTGVLVAKQTGADSSGLGKVGPIYELRRKVELAARHEALVRFKAEAVAVKTHAMYQKILAENR
jgi:hypothetical protein